MIMMNGSDNLKEEKMRLRNEMRETKREERSNDRHPKAKGNKHGTRQRRQNKMK